MRTTFRNIFSPALIATIAVAMGAGMAQAQSETRGLALELNKAEPAGANCRLSFVMSNQSATAVAKASYELVLFTNEGVIDKMSVFDFGDLPKGKTVVRQFELPGVDCSSAGNLLINGPAGCSSDKPSAHCSLPLSVSSRTSLSLTQ